MLAGITLKLKCKLTGILLCVSSIAFSKTYQTVVNGNWSDSLVWLANDVPAYSIFDTILIKDSIRFDHNLFLTANSHLLVDSGGGLCGHHTINVYTEATFYNAGIVEVDSLVISGGYFRNFGYGYLRFKEKFRVTNGGSAAFIDSSHGCGCYWEECFVGGKSYDDTVQPPDHETVPECNARVYPSVTDGNLKLEYNLFTSAWFTMYNTTGQLLFKKELNESSGIEQMNAGALSNGLYLWEVRIGKHMCNHGKIIVNH